MTPAAVSRLAGLHTQNNRNKPVLAATPREAQAPIPTEIFSVRKSEIDHGKRPF